MAQRKAKARPAARRRSAIDPVYLRWGAAVLGLLAALAVVPALLTGGRAAWWYAAAVNAVTVLLYAYDKRAAERRRGRTPELILHLLAAAGGSPAALPAQRLLRHKTRKVPFQIVFWVTVAAQLALALVGLAGLLSARGHDGRAWAALAAGGLGVLNVAAGMLTPPGRSRRASAAWTVMVLAGGSFGAAIADRARTGRTRLPCAAGAVHLALALAAAWQAVHGWIN